MNKFFGLLILLVVATVTAAYFLLNGGEKGLELPVMTNKAAVLVSGKAGSEKIEFLRSEAMQKIFADHGLQLEVQKAGSVEMVREPTAGLDFLWPASQVNLEYFAAAHGKALQSSDIFNSPIVLYAWDIVSDGLIANGIVKQTDGVNFIVDLPKLLQLIMDKKQWKDLGLNQLYGSISIRTTDPTRSNSGNMFAALIANTLNGGEVPSQQNIAQLLPRVRDFYARLGYMEQSSGVLFNMFLQQGAGAYPIIVGYENQLVEYSLEHSEALPLLKKKIRVLYPVPTVWASHPFIALTENGKKVLALLKDPEVQKLAWEQHGFRSGILGVENDPAILQVSGLPRTIDAVVPTPSASVMMKITDALTF